MKRSYPLQVDRLEDRCVPATLGTPIPPALNLVLVPESSNIAFTVATQTGQQNTPPPVPIASQVVVEATNTPTPVATVAIDPATGDYFFVIDIPLNNPTAPPPVLQPTNSQIPSAIWNYLQSVYTYDVLPLFPPVSPPIVY
jgi:hypothetical protein